MHLKKKVNLLTAIVCFILCFTITLQYKSVTRNKSMNTSQLQRNEELQTQLINANQDNIDLRRENLQLATDLEAYRSEAAESSDGANTLKKELDNALMLAGLTTVEGSGVTVTISDSKAKVAEGEDPSSYIVHDTDLRTVANELFTAGAEAVSINDERLISTSSVRCVGNTILVNNKRCAPPFVIKAIGDPASLEAGLNIREGIIDILKLYKIEVNVTKTSKVKIEKYSGAVNFKYAHNAEEQVKK